MGRTLTAILGTVCCLALSACSRESVAGPAETTPTPSTSISTPSTTSVSTPTTSVSTPSTTPTTTGQEPPPRPPKLPAVAKEKSSAGAKAFVQYYMGVLNYSWHIGSGTLARRYSTSDCIACRGIARSIDAMNHEGGFYRGGEWAAASPVLIPSEPLDAPIVHTALKQSAGKWKRSEDDHLRPIPSSREYVDVHLTRVGQSWKVTSMVFA